jgi:hypothetical protein
MNTVPDQLNLHTMKLLTLLALAVSTSTLAFDSLEAREYIGSSCWTPYVRPPPVPKRPSSLYPPLSFHPFPSS